LIFNLTIGGGRKTDDPERNKKLYQWYCEYAFELKLPVTTKLIKEKAREFSKNESFKASRGWLEKFNRKYELNLSLMITFKRKKKSVGE
jgi:hypothetical protein